MKRIGCIAEGISGAMALAAVLGTRGLRCDLVIGLPTTAAAPDAEALVVSLSMGTVADSLAALAWLRASGCDQFLLGTAANFDSDDGRIGAVADALIASLGCGFALACPAFPSRGISVYQGHLFLGATPPPEANLVRVLSQQSEGTVGLVPYGAVARGPAAVRDAMTMLREQGRRYGVADAVDDAQLVSIGAAAAGHPFIIGGAGMAMGMTANFPTWPLAADLRHAAPGRGAVLAGSGTRTTLYQIGAARAHMALLELDPLQQPDATALIAQALDWADQTASPNMLISSALPPGKASALQAKLGEAAATALTQTVMSGIASGLAARGVTRFVVAGEAAGVLAALAVQCLRIGAEIEPDVPWTLAHRATPSAPLLLALSAGHSGGRYLFVKAFDILRHD